MIYVVMRMFYDDGHWQVERAEAFTDKVKAVEECDRLLRGRDY